METLQKCIIDIKQILLQAQQKAYQATAFAMIEGFWRIGRRIVEEEQQGSIRANYWGASDCPTLKRIRKRV